MGNRDLHVSRSDMNGSKQFPTTLSQGVNIMSGFPLSYAWFSHDFFVSSDAPVYVKGYCTSLGKRQRELLSSKLV